MKPAPAALILVLAFASVIAANGLVDYWILASSPTNGGIGTTNSVVGYSWIVNGRIFHKENFTSIQAMYSFLGGPPTFDMYAARPVYPLLGSIIAPLVGAMPAFLLVNVVGWAVAAYCAVKLAELVSDSPWAPWITVALIVLAQGYWLHLTDYSAHMLSNCGYVVSVYILAKIGTANRALDLRGQIVAAVTIVAMALTYNTGLALLATYVLFACLRGSWMPAILTAILVLAAQRAWPFLYCWSMECGAQMQGTEGAYLARALHEWWRAAHDPSSLIEMLGRIGLQIIASDPLNLAVVLVCIGGLLTRQFRQRAEWFLFVAGMAPVAAALPWLSFAAARGYIANAGFGVLAVLASVLIARSGRAMKPIVACLVVVQAGWLISQSLGNVHPPTTYATGARTVGDFFAGFGLARTETASLTGHEATPQSLGGNGTVADAGGLEKTTSYTPQTGPSYPRVGVHAWSYRLYVFAPIMIAIALLSSRRRAVIALLAAAFVLPPFIASKRPPETVITAVTDLMPLPLPVKSVSQEVTLSDQAWDALRHTTRDDVRAELFTGILGDVKIKADLCGQRILDGTGSGRAHAIDHDALGRALQDATCDRILQMRTESIDGMLTGWIAWQRAGLPLRRLIIDGREPGDEWRGWPATELRIRHVADPAAPKIRFLFF